VEGIKEADPAVGEVLEISRDKDKIMDASSCRQRQVPAILTLLAQQARPLGNDRGVDRKDAIGKRLFERIDGAEELCRSVRVTSLERLCAAALLKECRRTQAKVGVVNPRDPATDIDISTAVQ